ncbi:uncharacterized protein DFL_003686 [Arthrobotrys flagrans]|uniref:Uncharacterized protein n=1 Tax=Arthrobotrys flagrans TaxID=97331 RepID=A0A437A2L3_ARTFL|nr:hypothetical protein DFL_003686 [Arthrobotrys flagrans]
MSKWSIEPRAVTAHSSTMNSRSLKEPERLSPRNWVRSDCFNLGPRLRWLLIVIIFGNGLYPSENFQSTVLIESIQLDKGQPSSPKDSPKPSIPTDE